MSNSSKAVVQNDLRGRVLKHFKELQFREGALAAYRRASPDARDSALAVCRRSTTELRAMP